MKEGSVTFENGNGGGGRPIAGANNGLSISATSFVVLGQDVGAAGNPAALLSNREIPYSAVQVIFNNLATAGTDLRIGLVSAGRVGLKINGATGGVATLWITNASAGTYKDWQYEAVTSGNGELILNDQVGNFFRM